MPAVNMVGMSLSVRFCDHLTRSFNGLANSNESGTLGQLVGLVYFYHMVCMICTLVGCLGLVTAVTPSNYMGRLGTLPNVWPCLMRCINISRLFKSRSFLRCIRSIYATDCSSNTQLMTSSIGSNVTHAVVDNVVTVCEHFECNNIMSSMPTTSPGVSQHILTLRVLRSACVLRNDW